MVGRSYGRRQTQRKTPKIFRQIGRARKDMFSECMRKKLLEGNPMPRWPLADLT
jgi:hypothetical protein